MTIFPTMAEKHRKRPRDANVLGKLIVDIATGEVPDRPPTPEEEGKSEILVSSGRRGGTRRAELLTPQARQEIARKAAKTRWRSSPSGKGTSAARGKKEHQ